MRPRARRVAVLGVGCGRGSPPLAEGVRDITPGKVFKIFDSKSSVWVQFGPENKLIEGQPNEYDVICRNASVLAFHLWPTIFAGAPFRLRNTCRNGVRPRSRTTTPLITCRQTTRARQNRAAEQILTVVAVTDQRLTVAGTVNLVDRQQSSLSRSERPPPPS